MAVRENYTMYYINIISFSTVNYFFFSGVQFLTTHCIYRSISNMFVLGYVSATPVGETVIVNAGDTGLYLGGSGTNAVCGAVVERRLGTTGRSYNDRAFKAVLNSMYVKEFEFALVGVGEEVCGVEGGGVDEFDF